MINVNDYHKSVHIERCEARRAERYRCLDVISYHYNNAPEELRSILHAIYCDIQNGQIRTLEPPSPPEPPPPTRLVREGIGSLFG